MEQIIVTSQKQFDEIPVDYNGRIIIKFGEPYKRAVIDRRFKYPVIARDNSSVEAWGNSTVEAWDNSTVVAWGNSTVVAWGNSTVVARNNSSVIARDNSSVEAWGNSTVEAWDNSTVVARNNSTVEARGNSTVVARNNSSVVAWGNSSVTAKANSQVVDASHDNSITTSGNARIVHNPTDIQTYIDHHEIECVDRKVKLYKAVRKIGEKYISDWNSLFEYKIGEVAVADGFTTDPSEDCGHGIHMAYKEWAVNYGRNWNNLAILELEADADGIIVPTYNDGKVRAASALVLREVPLEECGLLGMMLAKKLTD